MMCVLIRIAILMSTLNIPLFYRRSKNIPKLSPISFELPMHRTNFHGSIYVLAILVRLLLSVVIHCDDTMIEFGSLCENRTIFCVSINFGTRGETADSI